MTGCSSPGGRSISSGPSEAIGGQLLGAVLAGGRSRRFGRDKTAEAVGGVRMIERAVEALTEACSEVIVVSSRVDTPDGPWRIVPDRRPHRGPLAGIEAALAEAGRKAEGPTEATDAADATAGTRATAGTDATDADRWAVLVLAADLPLVDAGAVRELAEAFGGAAMTVDAVAAGREGDPGFEPLFAVYRRRCLPVVGRLLDEGYRAARELFEAVEGRTVRVGDDVASVNVNTEEDLAAAEARLAGRKETS